MKNFNIMEFTEKSIFRGRGVFTKKQYIEGIAEKGEAWTVCRFEGAGLGKKRGCF